MAAPINQRIEKKVIKSENGVISSVRSLKKNFVSVYFALHRKYPLISSHIHRYSMTF